MPLRLGGVKIATIKLNIISYGKIGLRPEIAKSDTVRMEKYKVTKFSTKPSFHCITIHLAPLPITTLFVDSQDCRSLKIQRGTTDDTTSQCLQ